MNEAFSIAFPGAKDYRLELSANSCINSEGNAIITVVAGADVASMKWILMPGKFPASAENLDYLDASGQLGELPGSGIYQVPANGDDGWFTFFALAYDADNKMVAGKTAYAYKVSANADQWKSIGNAIFVEGIITDFYANAFVDENGNAIEVAYEVPVQESIVTPGLYRLVNPYGEGTPLAQLNIHPTDEGIDHYLIINATDPNKVFVDMSPLGVDVGNGDALVCSLKCINPQYDTEIYCGILDSATRQIIFPAKSIVYAESGSDPSFNSKWYYVNNKGQLQITLPDTTGVEGIVVDDANAPAEFFNLQGQRVAEPVKGNLYIKRLGAATSKVVF